MSGSAFISNVPRPTYGATGINIPQELAILAGVALDFQQAYGAGLDFTNLETPHGQIASSCTAIIADKNDQVQWFVSMVDPATSEGRMQDGIAKIYFLERDPAQSTVVTCAIGGASGTILPAGTQAVDVNNVVYYLTSQVQIPQAETINATFACATTGPIACAANTLNRQYATIPGWDSINNPESGIEGTYAETPQQFEQRRYASVALNSRGSNAAVRSEILSLSGVLDAYITDNKTNASVTIGDVTLTPHSLYVCVDGGDDTDIATVILNEAAFGCDYNGNTTVTVYDQSYTAPYPSYSVTFNRPTNANILVVVNMIANTAVPSDGIAQVQQAVLNTFTGADGSLRPRIGGNVVASTFYPGIVNLGQWAQILNVKVGTSAANLDTVSVGIDQIPALVLSNITVVFA